ncbi:hypothetical protein ACWCQP_48820 [Streptomyces chartreusis]
MTRSLSSAPTPEYGAPYLPITTTRRTDMDSHRDEVSSKSLAPEEAEHVIEQITASTASRPSAGEWSEVTLSSSTALEIPDFDRSWAPEEITGWLANLEYEGNVSEADLARARRAVREALGVDD